MKVVFFGTPLFAAHVLSYLLAHKVDVVAVITKPDKPKGRSGTPLPTPVKEIARAHHLPVFQPELVSAPDFASVLTPFQADLFVVVAYGELIKQHLLDMPKLGCINVHPSLLPKYRGATPIQHSLIHGETETGVTIMHMVKKMDAGDMIHVVKVPIGPETTFVELEQTLWEVGSEALLQVIGDFERGSVPRTPQDESLVTFAPKIELENCELRWTQPAQTLHNLVRAVTPDPGAWCWVSVRGVKLRLKVLKSQVNHNFKGAPGEILSYGKSGFIICCQSEALRLVEVQLEGKRAMAAEELIRGIPRDQFKMVNS